MAYIKPKNKNPHIRTYKVKPKTKGLKVHKERGKRDADIIRRNAKSLELISAVDEYLKTCTDKEEEFHKTRGKTSNTYDRRVVVNIPSEHSFCKFVGMDRNTLNTYISQYPEFRKKFYEIREEQKERLIQKSLSGEYSALMAKFILSSTHGMTDRVDITSKGAPIFQISEDIAKKNDVITMKENESHVYVPEEERKHDDPFY